MIFRRLNNLARFIILACLFAFFSPSLMDARELNFSKCFEYYLNASKKFGDIRAIHIGNGEYLAHCPQKIQSESLIKRNESLNLCLFKDSKINLKFDLVKINKNAQTAAISEDSRILGKIISPQTSIINLAEFSAQIPPNAIISDICYQVYGISAQDSKFIDTNYINMFLASELGAFSSLGAEIESKNGAIVVTRVNSLLGQDLLKGDEILSANGKNFKNAEDFIDFIARLPLDSEINLKIKRNGKVINISTKTTEHSANGSFLAPFGINLDENLFVLNVSQSSALGLKENDKILAINGVLVKNIDDLNSALESTHARIPRHFGGSDWEFTKDFSGESSGLSILILRNNFEFFINKDER